MHSDPPSPAPWLPDLSDQFLALADRAWLNCAHQAPLPECARTAAIEAMGWKSAPWELTTERFSGVPHRLRRVLGALIGAPADDVILANSASYGLHLLANGLPWREGDEVLTLRGDFPSDILPWLGLEPRGVSVRQLSPRRPVPDADEVAAAIGPRTRLLCLTWVHSLSGWAIDLDGVGRACRDRGVLFVLNASQALGVRPLDVSRAPVDAVVSAGWKWLLGPYATGFCWIAPDLRETLAYNQRYWLSMLTSDDLGRDEIDLTISDDVGARRYDVFCPANFFNFVPWAASLEFLSGLGIETVQAHDQALVQRLLDGLDRRRFRVTSPEAGDQRSTLVFVEPARDRSRAPALQRALADGGVHAALRRGALRFSPHLYNQPEHIDRALAVLHSL